MRRRHGARRPVAFWLLILAIGLPQAGAAEDPDPDFSYEDTVKIGPFHAAPFLVVKDFGYDDNIRLTRTGRRTGDYTVTAGPGARAVVPFGRLAALSLWNEIDYVAYASETDLNTVNNEFRSKFHVYLRDFTLFTDARYRTFRERPDDEIDYRLRHNTLKGRYGVRYRPFRRGQFEVYHHRVRENYRSSVEPIVPPGFDPDLAERVGERRAESLDRYEEALGFDMRLRIRPRTTLIFTMENGEIDFDEDETPRDSRSTSSTAGLEFDPSGPIKGYLRVGFRHLEPVADRLDGYSGPIGRALVQWRALERSLVKVQYSRDTLYSVLGDNLFFLNETAGLGYEHFLSQRFSLDFARSIGTNTYPAPLQDPATCVEVDGSLVCDEKLREDLIVTDTMTFYYRMRPGIKMGLSVRRWERDSNFALENVSRITVYTSLEYVP